MRRPSRAPGLPPPGPARPDRACAGLGVVWVAVAPGTAAVTWGGTNWDPEDRFASQQPYRAEAAAGGSAPLPGAWHSPPGASRRRSPEAGPVPRPRREMKRIFGFGRKRKEQPPSGGASQPCPAGAYELRQKDLSKLHRAAASGDLAQVRQGLKKYGIDGRDKAER